MLKVGFGLSVTSNALTFLSIFPGQKHQEARKKGENIAAASPQSPESGKSALYWLDPKSPAFSAFMLALCTYRKKLAPNAICQRDVSQAKR
ncbi:MAG TPA: hypothetical protein DCY88_29360 [Cyanobacteria bacterium UBA11372]|nr:hypothetical protein [Cyanobacteria bacterium UBA11372]